jgi:hypothetical protein
VDQASVQAIQTMLAPVVLLTTGAILAGGVQTMYAAVNDRMRAMAGEKLSLLADRSAPSAAVPQRPDAIGERIRLIDAQLPLLLRRHWTLHNALLLIYSAILFIVIAMVLVALSVTLPADAVGDVALASMLIATVVLLVGVALVAMSVRESADAVDYEVEQVVKLDQ